MMTGLGLSEASQPKTEITVGLRTGWLRYFQFALGGASGTAFVLGGYEVLRAQPTQAFELLRAWGPAFLLGLVAIVVGGKLLESFGQTVRESFNAVAKGVQLQAEAASRTADSMTRLAEQGAERAQEIQRLAIYAAQEFPGIYLRFDRMDAVLQRLLERGTKSTQGGGDGN